MVVGERWWSGTDEGMWGRGLENTLSDGRHSIRPHKNVHYSFQTTSCVLGGGWIRFLINCSEDEENTATGGRCPDDITWKLKKEAFPLENQIKENLLLERFPGCVLSVAVGLI